MENLLEMDDFLVPLFFCDFFWKHPYKLVHQIFISSIKRQFSAGGSWDVAAAGVCLLPARSWAPRGRWCAAGASPRCHEVIFCWWLRNPGIHQSVEIWLVVEISHYLSGFWDWYISKNGCRISAINSYTWLVHEEKHPQSANNELASNQWLKQWI